MFLLEGFGMTPLEAMNFGCPCLLSDIPVLNECYTGYAKFTDPDKPEEIAKMLQIILKENKRFDKIDEINAKYNWRKSAFHLLNLIEHARVKGQTVK
jgi:glycosyltransferase involved in cell wall biosynthesis